MKKIILLPLLVLFLFSFITTENCDTMYNNANYGLMNSKKALKARNFEDQRYFANKALEAYYKVEKNLEECNCSTLNERVEKAIGQLEIAVDPYDWAKGRYYSQRVYESSLELVNKLDELRLENDEE